ncbi:MAG TPA: hypothetical protein VJQ44_08140 [Gemmatimonadales bacterium]|nr:hypothetical protein [Gemmatimonadales bacterium]
MIKAWLFLHILGFALWIGGAVASMVAGVSAKREGREGLGIVARAQAAIQKVLIGPGALITVLSGLMLTFRITGQNGDLVGFNPGLVLMQAAGIIGALVALLISLPTASKLARIDPAGPHGAYFDELRARQKVTATIAGTLALVALVGGVMVR